MEQRRLRRLEFRIRNQCRSSLFRHRSLPPAPPKSNPNQRKQFQTKYSQHCQYVGHNQRLPEPFCIQRI
jgi:hypothetical protein